MTNVSPNNLTLICPHYKDLQITRELCYHLTTATTRSDKLLAAIRQQRADCYALKLSMSLTDGCADSGFLCTSPVREGCILHITAREYSPVFAQESSTYLKFTVRAVCIVTRLYTATGKVLFNLICKIK